jgi:3-oxoacyl-(acyl-carrier-protein) synthase
MTDIAITGIGLITPLGVGREAFWGNCRQAKTGLKKIKSFDTDSFRANIAAWIDNFEPGQFMPSRFYRRILQPGSTTLSPVNLCLPGFTGE